MSSIAQNGEVIFRVTNFMQRNKYCIYVNVDRSADFEIEYRDPNDTTVE